MKKLNEDIDFRNPKEVKDVLIVVVTFLLLIASIYIYFINIRQSKAAINNYEKQISELSLKVDNVMPGKQVQPIEFDNKKYDEYIDDISEKLISKKFLAGEINHNYLDNNYEIFYPVIIDSHLFLDDFKQIYEIENSINHNLISFDLLKENEGWNLSTSNLYIFDSIYGFKDLKIDNRNDRGSNAKNVEEEESKEEENHQIIDKQEEAIAKKEFEANKSVPRKEIQLFSLFDEPYLSVPEIEDIKFSFEKRWAPIIDKNAIVINAINNNMEQGDLIFLFNKHRLLVWYGSTELQMGIKNYKGGTLNPFLYLKDSENKIIKLHGGIDEKNDEKLVFKFEEMNFPVEVLGFGLSLEPDKREYVSILDASITYPQDFDKKCEQGELTTIIANDSFIDLDNFMQYYNILDIRDRIIKDNRIEDMDLRPYYVFLIRPNRIVDYYEK